MGVAAIVRVHQSNVLTSCKLDSSDSVCMCISLQLHTQTIREVPTHMSFMLFMLLSNVCGTASCVLTHDVPILTYSHPQQALM